MVYRYYSYPNIIVDPFIVLSFIYTNTYVYDSTSVFMYCDNQSNVNFKITFKLLPINNKNII